MMKTTLLIAACSLGLFCFGTRQPEQKIEKAQWLLGIWENKTSKGSIYECWRKVSGTELAGKSYRIKEKDTIVLETIRLVEEQDRLFYIPTVGNQNNGQPVRFELKKISGNQLIFENPEHDFPQTITYNKKGSDSLIAEISGLRDGKEHRQAFPMKKVKTR